MISRNCVLPQTNNWQNGQLKVHQARVISFSEMCELTKFEPGQRTVFEGEPALITANGLLILEELQPAGKKSMPEEVFLRGAKSWIKLN